MKKQSSFVSMGIVSLFLIFSVFCMVILCLLTYSTSRSDLISSEQSLAKTTAYYEACSKTTALYEKLSEELQELHAATADDFKKQLSALLPENADYDPDTEVLSVRCPFSETQELFAEFALSYSEKETPSLSVKSWKTRITSEWSPDLHQNVYQKGAN